jgi:O-succinylbenzoic acid--CoA ligase
MRAPREWPERDPLAHRAETTPDRTAVVDPREGGAATDYRQFDREVDALAAGLAASDPLGGPATDDEAATRVAVLADDRAAVPRALFAATRLGWSVVPLNRQLGRTALVSALDRTDPTALVHDAPTADRATDLAGEVGLPARDLAALRDRRTAATAPPAGDARVDLDAERLVLFTSGTTGDPKGVRLSLRNLLASATGSAFRLGVLPGDRWLCCLPTYHMGGLAPWVRSALYGTTVVVGGDFDPVGTAREVDDHGVTGVSLVPTMLVRMLDEGWEPPASLRVVLLGGGPAPASLVERALAADVPLYPTYGMTETASQIATASPETLADHAGTVGQPLVTTAVTVVDEDGDPVERGEAGELVVDGPTVARGYLDPERTAAAVSERGLHTGDLGRRDAEGRLEIVGRVDDAFVSGGETVHPAAVADRLRAHPAVAEVAVVGVRDREWGRRVAAALVPAEETLAAERVLADCQADLATYERPRTVAVVDSLPRTASGTVDRAALRDRLADRGDSV